MVKKGHYTGKDGVVISYLEAGREKSDTTMILLPGLWTYKEEFFDDSVGEAISAEIDCRIIIPDLRGQGDSDGEIDPKATINDTMILVRSLRKKGCKKIVLMGISYGGYVSMAIASQLRIDALVIYSTPVSFHDSYLPDVLLEKLERWLKDVKLSFFSIHTHHPQVVIENLLGMPNLPDGFNLRRIECPMAMFYFEHDIVLHPMVYHRLRGKYEELFNLVASKEKELYLLKADHAGSTKGYGSIPPRPMLRTPEVKRLTVAFLKNAIDQKK